jgi:hypothetical protein
VTVLAPSSLFADDFDGGFANWSTVNAMTIDPAAGAPDPPSALVQTNASRAWASASLGGAYASVCASARINVASTLDGASLFRLRTAGDGTIIRVFVNAGRVLSLRSDVSGTQASTGVQVTLNSWTRIELCGTVGSAGSWTLYRDGTRVFGPWTANTGTTPIGRILIGTPDIRTISVRIDDVVVDLTPG